MLSLFMTHLQGYKREALKSPILIILEVICELLLPLVMAQIVDTANAQAQAIVKKAEERARILVSDAEIVKAAQQRAAEITAAAQSESRTLRQTVTDYCDNMLKTTEEAMVENAAQVKNVRANLRQNAKKNG